MNTRVQNETVDDIAKPNQTVVTAISRQQKFYATVIKRCDNCHAPGVDERGEDVGKYCPKCGVKRPKNINKGTIWERIWR